MTGEINICDLDAAIYYGQIDYSYRDIINEFDYKLHLIEGQEDKAIGLQKKFNKAKIYAEIIGDGKDKILYLCELASATGIIEQNYNFWNSVGYPTIVKKIPVKTKRFDDILGKE